MCSQSSQCVLQHVPSNTTLSSHMLFPKLSSFWVGQRETFYISMLRVQIFVLGASKVSVLFFMMGQSKLLNNGEGNSK
jgi:hypothetical protein